MRRRHINLLSGMGESAVVSLSALEARIRRDYAALGRGRLPALALQAIAAPVFHGHAFSIAIELDRPVEIVLPLKRRSAASTSTWCLKTPIPRPTWPPPARTTFWCAYAPCSKAATPRSPRASGSGRLLTTLRLAAQNAMECALDLRRLRPQGAVQ